MIKVFLKNFCCKCQIFANVDKSNLPLKLRDNGWLIQKCILMEEVKQD
jgi:hypothetical protein